MLRSSTRGMSIVATLPRAVRLAPAARRSAPGLNTHPNSANGWPRSSRELTGLPFISAPNKFAALAAHDALVSRTAR